MTENVIQGKCGRCGESFKHTKDGVAYCECWTPSPTNMVIEQETILICNGQPPETSDTIVQLNNELVRENDIFCFIPNRDVELKSADNLCFIPFGPNSWTYKQMANAIHHKLGIDNVIVFHTDITYPFHKKVGLSFNETLDISIIVAEFFLEEDFKVVKFNSIPKLEGRQKIYFDKMVEEKRYLLNG